MCLDIRMHFEIFLLSAVSERFIDRNFVSKTQKNARGGDLLQL